VLECCIYLVGAAGDAAAPLVQAVNATSSTASPAEEAMPAAKFASSLGNSVEQILPGYVTAITTSKSALGGGGGITGLSVGGLVSPLTDGFSVGTMVGGRVGNSEMGWREGLSVGEAEEW
jgi:hypothetical protein